MNKVTMVGLLGLAVLLGGCSASEPDQHDISDALKVSIDKVNEKTKNLPMKLAVEFVSVRKISCTPEAEKNHYKCDAEIETIAPIVGRLKRITSVPLVNDNGTWRVVE